MTSNKKAFVRVHMTAVWILGGHVTLATPFLKNF